MLTERKAWVTSNIPEMSTTEVADWSPVCSNVLNTRFVERPPSSRLAQPLVIWTVSARPHPSHWHPGNRASPPPAGELYDRPTPLKSMFPSLLTPRDDPNVVFRITPPGLGSPVAPSGAAARATRLAAPSFTRSSLGVCRVVVPAVVESV